jgi:hypothetical protein
MGQNVFPATGNVGIGTATPGAPLVVNGKARILSTLSVGLDADGPAFFPVSLNGGDGASLGYTLHNQPTDQKVWALIANGNMFRLLTEADNYGSIREAMVFKRTGLEINSVAFPNGNVSIGTSNAQGYRLAVNGDAIFTKAKVKDFGNWPDYVFNKDYQLPALAEVEKFIQQNKHLPGIPAAAEVQQKGLDLGDNQAALLKKIEELTLYIIEQNKRMDTLEKKLNDALKSK